MFAISSINNYPGGEALARLNEMYSDRQYGMLPCNLILQFSYQPLTCEIVTLVHVHISNLAAQTGASLFQHTHAPPYPINLGLTPAKSLDWIYNKTENVPPEVITANRRITHVIAEVEGELKDVFQDTGFSKSSWAVTAIVSGFDRWNLNRNALKLEPTRPWKVLEYVESKKLAILERKGW